MESFEYTPNPSRILFGSGTITKLPQILSELGLQRPLLLSTPQQTRQAEDVQTILHCEVAGVFDNATMHTPVEITDQAVQLSKSSHADSVISIGGGSTVGLGKAIAIGTGLHHIAIPTTYAGSEVTPILGETVGGVKETRTDRKIFPGTFIYDIDLTLTLPVALSATSGINAIAHAVEALYARNGNPIVNIFAQQGIKALASALPQLLDQPKSQSARSSALYGAWLCGVCLGSVGMSLHHKLCHTLGGSFNLPHAETHTIILPHALSYNAGSVPTAMESLAAVFPGSSGDAITGLNTLLANLRVEKSLSALGMKEADIDRAADIAVSNPCWNPREIDRTPVRELIRRAWAGEEARSDI
ncbi:Fc.00g054920.m01.CDS01 [Cosmosporella sp. VM-42]